MTYRTPCAFALAAALLASPSQAEQGAEAHDSAPVRPNVLVILADDLGYADLGCYGGEIATPQLDALAAEGLRYTQFYNTARCWPTRAALLTGYYAQQVRRDAFPDGPRGGQGTRPAWAPLLSAKLQELGYRTYHAGKWHVDGQPLQQGFDRSYSLEDHDRYFSPRNHTLDDVRLEPAAPTGGYYATTEIAQYAIDFLQQHEREFADRPFFAYVAFTSPHFPLHAPAADVARYADAYRAGWDVVRQTRWDRMRGLLRLPGELAPLEAEVGPPYHFPAALKALGAGEANRELAWDQLTAEQQRFQAAKMAVHAAMVDRMDQEIGRVLAQVRAMGAWNDTLICFLSDNGASAEIMVRGDKHDPTAAAGSAASYLCLGPGWSRTANAPFRRHKTWVHEGGIATPLIMHWPAGIAARGELRHAVGHVVDLAPTIYAAAGGAWPTDVGWAGGPVSPGRPLQATWAVDAPLGREALWWLHEANRALRRGDWKLVAARDEPWELYDLGTDRSETRNLAADHPALVAELSALWERMRDTIAADAAAR
jgi:arylsulfatase